MNMVARALMGLLGLVALAVAALLWFDPDDGAMKLGLSLSGDVGRAAVRADIAGLFLAVGIFSILAAIYQSVNHVRSAFILTAAVFVGRMINFVASGMAPSLLPPIGLELAMMVIYFSGMRMWDVRASNHIEKGQ